MPPGPQTGEGLRRPNAISAAHFRPVDSPLTPNATVRYVYSY